MHKVALALMIALGVVALTGCSNPCDELAELTCKENGATSQVCQKMREEADRSGPQTQRSCAMALDLLKTIDESK